MKVITVEKFEKFKQDLLIRLQEDKKKAQVRLDAMNELEYGAIGFNKGMITTLSTTMFDIAELERELYND